MRPLSLLVLIVLSGCASMSRPELAWQAVHAVDVAQTLNIVNDPCYVESNPITTSLIGEQPSTGEVIAWGVGAGVLHYGVSRYLEHTDAPRWMQNTWQAITLTTTAGAVYSNHREGIRISGSNEPFAGCTL